MRPSFEKLIPPDGFSIRCFNRAEVDKPANWHYHPEIELTFVERGSGTRFVGDHIANYHDGDLVLLGSNLPHHWASDEFRGQKYDRHPAIVVQFLPDLFGEHFLSMPELFCIVDLVDRARRGLLFSGSTQQMVSAEMVAMLHQAPFDRLMSLLRCLQLLGTSSEAAPLATENFSPSFRHKTRTRLHDVCQFIHENLTNAALTQLQIAEFAGMTPAAFSRFFRSATQRTVTEYVNELRIGLASRMLAETDQSILEICMQTGFDSPSNFNRRFRQFKAMSPRQYRSHHRRLNEVVA